ncbi:hypothetical protein Plhal304r1_c013g0050171 [Plasmopara halstedii]
MSTTSRILLSQDGRKNEAGVSQRPNVSPDRTSGTPCLFPGGSGVTTNDLDKAQKQLSKAFRRTAIMRAHSRSVLGPRVEYGFRLADPATEAREAIARLLGVYVVGPSATKQAELDEQKTLRACFLALQEILMDTYLRFRVRSMS